MKNLIPALLCALAPLTATASVADSVAALGYAPATLDERIGKSFNDYVGELKYYDVFLNLPQNFKPIDIRGREQTRPFSNPEYGNRAWHYWEDYAAAIIEANNENAAVILPIVSPMAAIPDVERAEEIATDLRINAGNWDLDIDPLIDIIALDDMSRYASADTVAIYEFDFKKNYLDRYAHCVGIYLRKANHPALPVRLVLSDEGYKNKAGYIQMVLDNIRYGNHPAEVLENAERYVSGTEYVFPGKGRYNTGILPNINEETLAELNRQRAWLKEHGLEKMPEVSDDIIDALNGYYKERKERRAKADSIENADMFETDKIYPLSELEREPSFPGGFNAEIEWISSNVRYPEEALKKGLQASVHVNFTVMADGSLRNVVADTTRAVDPAFVKEALRLVNTMPAFVPALYKGHEVCANSFTFVSFVLPPEKRMEVAEKTESESKLYSYPVLQIKPEFPGGRDAMTKWIEDNIRYTPEIVDTLKTISYTGVSVKFIIDSKGNIVSPQPLSGRSKAFTDEATRLMKAMPRWVPGFYDGKPVDTSYFISIPFRLPENKE